VYSCAIAECDKDRRRGRETRTDERSRQPRSATAPAARDCRFIGTSCLTPACRLSSTAARAVAVLCGSIDIGQGSDSILADAEAKGFGIDPGDTRELTADTELTPVSGEELQASTRQVIEQPPQLIGRVKELLGGN
jgi:CO/xanthine dehydrogenase Mo-binding subunit